MLSSRRVICPNRFPAWPRLLSILLAGLIAGDACLAARHPEDQVQRAAPRFEVLPLVRSLQNQLLVQAFVNGRPTRLIVDSGSPMTLMALNRRRHFRLTAIPAASALPTRLQINGAYNNLAIAHSLRLDMLNIVDLPVVLTDLGGSEGLVRARDEQQINGILGVDVLFATKAILDCQQEVLILKMDPDLPGRAPGVDYRGFTAVPFQVSDGFNLYVNAAINGTAAKLMIDTGASGTMLHYSFLGPMRVRLRETSMTSVPVNLKQSRVRAARLRKLSVGSVNITGTKVGVLDLGGLVQRGPRQDSRPVAGLLGSEILRRHHGIIDFGTRTLYLKK
jgi:predicted aspartyl protease